ncbi:MAG: purine permease [Pseudomonadota bacterium]|nr:purine permease [Pseudomonadota bacterium]
MSAEPATDLLYGLEVRPPLSETLCVAVQHVFAVFVGMITPPLLIAGALKLNSADTAYLISMSLFVSGAATILQTSRLGPIGSGLLSIQGTSFTFIAPIISVATAAMAAGATATQALGGIFGLCLAGALTVIVASRFIQRASAVITPVVTGTVVTLIGLTLIEVGMVSVGGGYGARADGTFGSPENLGLAGLVMVVILVISASRSPRLRMLSVVLGLLAGYAAAALLGRLDLSGMHNVPPLNLPSPLRFGLSFDSSAFLPFLFMYLITVMESIGDLTATSSLTGQPISGPLYFSRLRGGLLADGINSAVGACLNSFPSTTFAQNNGVIRLTGVGSRYVGLYIGGILMLLGLIPAVGVVVQALPPSALGGATLILFGMVAASGMRILAQVHMDRRNAVILAASLGLGLGVSFVPQITQALPTMLRNALSSGIATGGMCALLLNIVLPGERQ